MNSNNASKDLYVIYAAESAAIRITCPRLRGTPKRAEPATTQPATSGKYATQPIVRLNHSIKAYFILCYFYN